MNAGRSGIGAAGNQAQTIDRLAEEICEQVFDGIRNTILDRIRPAVACALSAAGNASEEGCVIECRPAGFELRGLTGEAAFLPARLVGARRLLMLLRNPGVEVELQDLVAADSHGPFEVSYGSRGSGQAPLAMGDGCDLDTGYIPQGGPDGKARDAARKEMERLIGMREKAVARGDDSLAEELKQDIRQLKSYCLTRAVHTEMAGKEINRIRMSVSRTISMVARTAPELAAHLDRCITANGTFRYDPEPGWDWKLRRFPGIAA